MCWWPYYLFYFILVYFHITHQVLVELPQGVGGLAFFLFCFVLFCFILFYFVLFILIYLFSSFG
jgi:hypothetical protein